MSVFTGFYKRLIKISFFRKKAIDRLVNTVAIMDRTDTKQVSENKRYWLDCAKKNKTVKIRPGLYKANLMIHNDILPECKFYVYLDILENNTFVCFRTFSLDHINLDSKWEGPYISQGDYLLLDSDFYFRETVIESNKRGGFSLNLNPGTGPVIYFNKLDKTEVSQYRSGVFD